MSYQQLSLIHCLLSYPKLKKDKKILSKLTSKFTWISAQQRSPSPLNFKLIVWYIFWYNLKGYHYSVTMANAPLQVKFVTNRLGKNQNLLHNGFKFQAKNRRGERTYWKCSTANCPATINTLNNLPTKVSAYHNHGSDQMHLKVDEKTQKDPTSFTVNCGWCLPEWYTGTDHQRRRKHSRAHADLQYSKGPYALRSCRYGAMYPPVYSLLPAKSLLKKLKKHTHHSCPIFFKLIKVLKHEEAINWLWSSTQLVVRR